MNKNSSQILSKILEIFPGNIFWVDLDGVIFGSNNSLARLHGFKRSSDMEGKVLYDLISDDSAKKLRETTNVISKTKEGIEVTEWVEIKKKIYIFQSKKYPITDKSGNVVGIIGMSFDITDQFKDKEKVDFACYLKENLFRVLQHDLRTPIHGMSILIDHMLNDTPKKSHKTKLTKIQGCVSGLLDHCASLYEQCRIGYGSPPVRTNEPASIYLVLSEVLDIYKPAATIKGLDIYFDIDDNFTEKILGDKNRIKQIVLHLFSNAIKFTNTGKAWMSARIAKEEESRYIVEIKICDTGVGVSEKIKDIIYEEFSTEKPVYMMQQGGLGLGLSLVKKLVFELSGEIYVESEIDKGSSFVLLLPLKKSLRS